ncbi:MAG: MBL fold metallo-hydrolase [Candidatus Cloacimonetes bacterium]|nr:MBL fold metallo-hydrolase [Candidatus Cloacimonadota bacterium]
MVKVKWFGHSFWEISTEDMCLVTDPFSDIGYSMPEDLKADVVLSSHDHFDHNNISLIQGNYELLRSEGSYNLKGVAFELIPVWHDENQGKNRGKNLLLKFALEGKTFLHCGDLGHLLSKKLIRQLGKIDILLIPVGGVFTIDAELAKTLCTQLNPQIIFPMHYKTPVLKFELAPLSDFTKYYQSVINYDKSEVALTEDLFRGDEPAVIILNYAL